MNELVNNITQTEDNNEYLQQLFLTALQMTDEFNRLSLLLVQLLESVSNLDSTHLNLNIIPNTELKNQVELIQKYVVKSLMVPDKNLYSIMKMKPYLSRKNIIFKITIPLLLIKKFQIFKTFATPFKYNNKYLIVNNISPYILTSMDFKRYELLNEQMLEQCQNVDENTKICHGPNRFKNDRMSTCEWDTLTYQNISSSCEFLPTKIVEQYLEFGDNKYIYAVSTPTTATAACGQKIVPIKLSGEGFLSLNDDCTFDSGNHNIIAKKRKNNTMEIHPWNELNYSLEENIQPRVVKTLEALEQSEFKPLEESIEKLKNDGLKINTHDVHHYALIYVIIAGILAGNFVFKITD